MIRHVGFDFDGVLAQGSNEAYIDSYHRAMLQVGIEMDRELERQRIFERWGQPVEEQIELLLLEHPHKRAEAIQVFNEARRSPAFRARVSLFPGAEETLRALHHDYTLSIVSGAERALIESVLGPELTKLFTSIYSAAEYPPHLQKPAPHMLKLALESAGTSPDEAVYIGDAPNDLRMAVAASVEPVAILTGHMTRSQAAQLGARHIIDEITEFPEVIASL
jgi:HAD superfamily hydrolase (TIGR01549 family)